MGVGEVWVGKCYYWAKSFLGRAVGCKLLGDMVICGYPVQSIVTKIALEDQHECHKMVISLHDF